MVMRCNKKTKVEGRSVIWYGERSRGKRREEQERGLMQRSRSCLSLLASDLTHTGCMCMYKCHVFDWLRGCDGSKYIFGFHHVVDCPAINGHASKRERDSFLQSQQDDMAKLYRQRDLIEKETVQNERLSTQISRRVRLDRSSASNKSIDFNLIQSSRFLHAHRSSLKIEKKLEDEKFL
ncbi:hypothetical protein YC2023_056527 [Brassica napus]